MAASAIEYVPKCQSIAAGLLDLYVDQFSCNQNKKNYNKNKILLSLYFAGIISRLPYLKDLGIGAVWLSPFFKSPMKDFGYDVSDYREVDPLFGTLQEFDNMIKEAHSLGITSSSDILFYSA